MAFDGHRARQKPWLQAILTRTRGAASIGADAEWIQAAEN